MGCHNAPITRPGYQMVLELELEGPTFCIPDAEGSGHYDQAMMARVPPTTQRLG